MSLGVVTPKTLTVKIAGRRSTSAPSPRSRCATPSRSSASKVDSNDKVKPGLGRRARRRRPASRSPACTSLKRRVTESVGYGTDQEARRRHVQGPDEDGPRRHATAAARCSTGSGFENGQRPSRKALRVTAFSSQPVSAIVRYGTKDRRPRPPQQLLRRQQRLGPHRGVRVRRQLGRQHRQRLLRRPAVQPRHLARRTAAPAGRTRTPARRRSPSRSGSAPPRAATAPGRSAAPAPDDERPRAADRVAHRGGPGRPQTLTPSAGPRLLGPAEVRLLADGSVLRPTKQRGQNFVIDPNTVRRIVRASGVDRRRRRARGRTRARLADPGAARRRRAGSSRSRSTRSSPRRCRPPSRRTHPTRPTGSRSSRPTRCGSPICRDRHRPRWSPTCPTTSRCPCCCTCWRCCRRCGTDW